MQILFFFSILPKSFSEMGNSMPSSSGLLTIFLSAFVILSGSLMDLNAWYDKEIIYCQFLILIRPFIESLNLQGNSMYVLPNNGLKIETFTYSASTDSVTDPNPSLI